MSEPNGPVCPECGTPRAPDGTPDCSCGRLASDAHRETRTAEAAAAEDFDPVRIRPFVELDGGPADDGQPEGTRLLSSTAPSTVPPDRTPAPRITEAEGDTEVGDTGVSGLRGRPLLFAGVGAALAALLTGAFVSGLFSYDSPAREAAPPDGVRAPLPGGSAPRDNSPGQQAHGTSSPSVSPGPTASPRTTPTAGPGAPSRSAPPTGTPSGPAVTASTSPTAGSSAPQAPPPVLRFGDQGPEVTELQLRLRQVGLYAGEGDGDYDREVEGAVRTYQLTRVVLADESGVYGGATRKSLESETRTP
ncbi:peptidoglycan-binding protein [Streptomyces sp. NPDC001920]